MAGIPDLVKILRSMNEIPVDETRKKKKKKKLPRNLTFDHQMIIDEGRTIEIRTGLTQTEFDYVLNLLEAEISPVRRGRKLLETKIRLVFFHAMAKIRLHVSEYR